MLCDLKKKNVPSFFLFKRYDWYQTESQVIVTIMIKNAQKDDVSVQFLERKVISVGYWYSSLNSWGAILKPVNATCCSSMKRMWWELFCLSFSSVQLCCTWVYAQPGDLGSVATAVSIGLKHKQCEVCMLQGNTLGFSCLCGGVGEEMTWI